MSLTEAISKLPLRGMQLSRARIRRIGPDGSVHIGLDPEGSTEYRCDVLQATPSPHPWAVGDEVLVATPEAPEARPIILGVVAAGLATGQDSSIESAGRPTSPGPTADTTAIRNTRIVVEAGEELILQCGGGTIKIRQDGKIIISGEHVLTRARGTQRIKGGSVAIN